MVISGGGDNCPEGANVRSRDLEQGAERAQPMPNRDVRNAGISHGQIRGDQWSVVSRRKTHRNVLMTDHYLNFHARVYYSAPDRGARSIVMSVSAFVCVCLSVCDHIFGTTRPIFTEFFCACYLWPWLDPPLAAYWYFIYFRFMDDVIFSHKPRLLDVAAQVKRNAHAALGLAIKCAQ